MFSNCGSLLMLYLWMNCLILVMWGLFCILNMVLLILLFLSNFFNNLLVLEIIE